MDEDMYKITQQDFLERYKISTNIANTGFSRVFLAEDKKYSRTVVIKFFAPSMANLNHADKAEFRHRFDLEARAMAQLNHPNLVQIYDFGVANKAPYMVFEYIKGSDLKIAMRKMRGWARREDKNNSEKIAKQQMLEEFLVMFYQICDCIQYVHKNRVIHRDLKPGNVLLQKNGKLVVCDLGLAKVLEKEKKISSADYTSPPTDSSSGVSLNPCFMTADGVALGTPAFMAPEQVLGKKTDERTDIYQLGAILYEAIKGRPPFAEDGSDFSMRRDQNKHDFDVPDADPMLLDTLLLALKLEPEKRHKDVASFKQDIHEYIEHLLNKDDYIVEKPGGLLRKAEKKKIPKTWLNWSDIARKWARL